MRRILLSILPLLMLSACGSQKPLCAAGTAEAVVASTEPATQFGSILRSIVSRTATVASAQKRQSAGFDAKLTEAVNASVARHQDVWINNMVSGWKRLEPQELQAACSAINGRNKDAFMQLATKIGPDIQRLNEPLLRRAGAEVLAAIDK